MGTQSTQREFNSRVNVNKFEFYYVDTEKPLKS